MVRRRSFSRVLVGALTSLALLLTGSASAATITPNTTADEFGEGADCGLREAIQSANTDTAFGGCTTGAGADTIPLADGTYAITRPGTDFANANGSFDIPSPVGVTITHTGPGAAILDGGGHTRVIGVVDFTGNATISGVTIRNGNGPGDGAGVFSNGTLNLSNSTLSANVAAFDGAGLAIGGGTATLTNVTVSDNRARFRGGGIAVTSGGSTLNMNNVTVSGNVADADANGVGDGGGLWGAVGTTLNLQNSLVAGNTDSGGQAPDCFGSYTSQGNNLIGNPTGCAFGGAGGDLLNVDPLLGPLADNGGGTFTHALSKGSPAINAGGAGAAPSDQRGLPRAGAPDIGAYEFVRCGKVAVNRIGTDGKDKLTGTPGADGILALGGKDVLKGLAGKDGLCGGKGKDTLKGGKGKDRLIGGKGADKLGGGGGKDICKGGKGKDKLVSC